VSFVIYVQKMSSFFDRYFHDFDCHSIRQFSISHYWVPLAAAGLYILLLLSVPQAFRPHFKLRNTFALWNFLMSAFSICGFSVALPYTVRGFRDHGLHYMVCSDQLMFGNDIPSSGAACYRSIGLFMTAFMLSKIPELFDTVFLVLQGKPVLFLHWFHHLTVMLCSWYAYATATPTAVTFATVNYGVHSLMYFYFGVSQYTKAMNHFRRPITFLQLWQMVMGLFFTSVAGYYHFYDGSCTKVYPTTYYFEWNSAMYGSYLILFAKLYYENYILKARKRHVT
jgi:elongation of very long chain fatty acids protein 6